MDSISALNKRLRRVPPGKLEAFDTTLDRLQRALCHLADERSRRRPSHRDRRVLLALAMRQANQFQQEVIPCR